jgi:Arrestin (or S-antigen), C-terminal domain
MIFKIKKKMLSKHYLPFYRFIGYVSGETIHINGYVKNFSKVTVRHTKIVLLETIHYLSRGKIVQVEKREIASIKGAKIRSGSKDDFVNKKLYIPPLPPTNIRNSNLIQLNYDVYVSYVFTIIGRLWVKNNIFVRFFSLKTLVCFKKIHFISFLSLLGILVYQENILYHRRHSILAIGVLSCEINEFFR